MKGKKQFIQDLYLNKNQFIGNELYDEYMVDKDKRFIEDISVIRNRFFTGFELRNSDFEYEDEFERKPETTEGKPLFSQEILIPMPPDNVIVYIYVDPLYKPPNQQVYYGNTATGSYTIF